MEGKAAMDKARKDQILLQLQDDKVDRKTRAEVQGAFTGVVAATALPAPPNVRLGGGAGGGEEEEEEEEEAAKPPPA